jgi:hypothetical protein
VLVTCQNILFPRNAAPTGAEPGLIETDMAKHRETLFMMQNMQNDGFDPASSDTARGGKSANYLKWTAEEGWRDRDGTLPPQPLLVLAVAEFLRRWKDGVATDKYDKPLPNVDGLNASVPYQEWEKGLDGKPRPPWEYTVGVYLVSTETGERYTYTHSTAGAKIAEERLREAVVTMRMIRGDKCMPLVALGERPFKTQYKMTTRPHFEIVGWKTPGENAGAIAAPPSAPQLPSPGTAEKLEPAPEKKPDPISSGPIDKPAPLPSAAPGPKPKRTVNALNKMGDVKPPTSREILDDDIQY